MVAETLLLEGVTVHTQPGSGFGVELPILRRTALPPEPRLKLLINTAASVSSVTSK